MEAKELMIGDWVLDGTKIAQVTSITCDGNTREMVVIYPTGTIIARTLDDKSCASCGFIPYLRPMSSMTRKEEEHFLSLKCELGYNVNTKTIIYNTNQVDWLNAYHFDYRGLIEKGLAIDCTNLNIY